MHRVSICGGLDLPKLVQRGGELHPSLSLHARNDAVGQRAEREVRMRKVAGSRGFVGGGWGSRGAEGSKKMAHCGFCGALLRAVIGSCCFRPWWERGHSEAGGSSWGGYEPGKLLGYGTKIFLVPDG